jgi:NAD+ synthase
MPIRQRPELHDLSIRQGQWLTQNFSNVTHEIVDLTTAFDEFEKLSGTYNSLHGFANSRSRLRMITLYQIAQSVNGIVVGTGNKVEDFGVGFYTKYGDGGVDISPIADLFKSEVWALGQELGILQDIIDAPPTDGLWDDGRTDEDQLGGLNYADLELAMQHDEGTIIPTSEKELANLESYRKIRSRSLHKMAPIPIFKK